MMTSDDTPEEKPDPTWEELRVNPVLFMSDSHIGDMSISDYQRKAIARIMNIYGVKLEMLGDVRESASAATSKLQEQYTLLRARQKRGKQ